MSAPRNVQLLLDRLHALDASIAEHRTALGSDELASHERAAYRVALGMLGFERAKTQTQLWQTGWRPGQPEQADLLR